MTWADWAVVEGGSDINTILFNWCFMVAAFFISKAFADWWCKDERK